MHKWYKNFVGENGKKYCLCEMKNNLLIKSLEFSLETIRWLKTLHLGDMNFMKNQLQRSSTSVGANIREANSSKSTKDFVNKLKTAYQELEESEYWIKIMESLSNQAYPERISLLLLECKKMLNASISTAIKNAKIKKPLP